MNINKGAVYILSAIILLIILAIILGFAPNKKADKPVETITYTVCKGDTLYSIAADHGIKDWRKWAHETEKSGMIYPGDIIIIKK